MSAVEHGVSRDLKVIERNNMADFLTWRALRTSPAIRGWARRGLVAAVVMLSAACSDADKTTWTEEVRSHDGTVFVLEGEGLIAPGSLTTHRGGVIYQSYFHRPTQAYWRGPNILRPNVFDLIDGAPHVMLLLGHSHSCKHFNYPEQSVVVFRWSSTKGWRRVALDFPIENITFNVLYQVFSTRDKARDVSGHVDIANKDRRDRKMLKDWIDADGGFCAKSRQEPGLKTDYVIPDLSGFHARTEV